MPINTNEYETEMQVRPDDIDMFQHVHSSRYIDYVLAARYDQMDRCYGMPMEEFLRNGYGWVISSTTINYKRALKMGDHFTVRTQLAAMEKMGCEVRFTILNKGKVSCDGVFHYTMINLQTGRAETVPDWIVQRYSLPSV